MTKHRKIKAAPENSFQAAQTPGAADEVKSEKPPVAPTQPRLRSKKEEGEVKPPSAPVRLFNFFRDAKKELARVSWPTRKETVKSTAVLLVLVAISAAYLGLVDSFLSWILRLLVG
ncbi:MAG: preprotein translocase subunit SecE [Deltaproteobacteria bacterium]|jgi:preprotein translocase subunit SecE|nr:preprotein translocase subunit SecE [Deltaproteobacteria bacterium]